MGSDYGRKRYDGAAFRALRERHGFWGGRGLNTIVTAASLHIGDDIFVMSSNHVRQWERGQRNISEPLAARLAAALAKLTGDDITTTDFELGHQAAA